MVVFPYEFVEDWDELVEAVFIDVEWVCVEEFCGGSLYGFVLVIDLEVAVSKIHVCVVLVPSEHEVAVRFYPLDFVEVIVSVWWEIK
ncbi:hypothetical protein LPA44_12655 [Halobacterium sp. KA-4]|uniref:hypothetical protein n=1 Tax=Halobacterium sp. KA-4 TaxID=2896367 RepID=UPI001E52C1B4|nr:hypothetical protein [Halobacterium sp. KA-4]MCD2200741.1 hypothetical protein [Halobacterium sp. KA-4]